MRNNDARAYLQVQRAAVRGIAAKDYPPAVIEQWAPLPITDEAIAEVRTNRDNEIRVLAEINGEIGGDGLDHPNQERVARLLCRPGCSP